jgi:methyl-accepting chemotaxis protein
MSIRYKLFLAFSVVVVIATGVAFYGVKVVSDTSALVVRLYDGPLMAVSHARSAQWRLSEARHAMERAIILRDSSLGTNLDEMEKAMNQFAADMAVVRERMVEAGSNVSSDVDSVLALADQWYKMGLSYLKPPAGGLTELPRTAVLYAKANDLVNTMEILVEYVTANGFNFRTRAEETATSSQTNLIVLAGVAGVIGLLLAFGIASSFTRPIRNAMGMSERIAAGDFSGAAIPRRRDELGRLLSSLDQTRTSLQAMEESKERDRTEQLAKLRAQVEGERQKAEALQNKTAEEQAQVVSLLGTGLSHLARGDLTFRLDDGFSETYRQIRDDFNTAIEKLQETIGAIATATRDVAGTAAEISSSTTDLSQRTEEQAASLEETSASMEQIAATVRKNAENAQQANAFANTTHEVADRGGEVVGKAVAAMARIEQSSTKISDIISVIDEIARQTNLLALNAAVEAARAGEAGRGFAVVASEVRSLAQRSAQAAKDIKELITSSTSQVKEGVDLVNRAGNSLHEIVDSIKHVAAIVGEIASASSEQAAGLDQVNVALAKMDEVTQQNSALVEQNAAAAKSLEEQSRAMAERVTFFRTEMTTEAVEDARAVSARLVGPRRHARAA